MQRFLLYHSFNQSDRCCESSAFAYRCPGGTGKTTILREAISPAKTKAGGFYTQEICKNKSRVGFEIITLDGSRAVLTHINLHGPHRVGKYGVDVGTFDKVAVASPHRALQESQIIVVDEIGKMELFSFAFKEIILEILNSGKRMPDTIMLQSNPLLIRSKAIGGPSTTAF